MPTQCSPDLFGFAPVEGRRVVAGFDGGAVTSDAGALLLGATDRAIGLAWIIHERGMALGQSTRPGPSGWALNGALVASPAPS